jgi:hypothetical protein
MPAMRFLMAFLAAMATLWPASSFGWTVNIASGPTRLYLQAGVGAFNGLFVSGGTPAVSTVENIVSASPSPATFGTGPITMTSDSTATNSFYDGASVCPGGGSLVYIGGLYRGQSNNPATINLTATVPANLVDALGRGIPFGSISWATSIARSPDTVQIPSGRFVGGTTQTMVTVSKNTWFEDCFTFSYDNSDRNLLAGTYTGQVVFTLAVP